MATRSSSPPYRRRPVKAPAASTSGPSAVSHQKPGAVREAPAYYALVVPGIEDIAASEIESCGSRVRDVLRGIDRRDGILLFDGASPAAILRCGTVEDVFLVLLYASAPQDRAALRRVGSSLPRETLERAIAVRRAARPGHKGRSYKVVARLAGKRPYRREDIGRTFARALATLLPRWSETDGKATLEFWVHVAGERLLVGLRLSGDELAQRPYGRAHLPASLKPTVARALVLLSQPGPNDVFLDPMAGAGTILRERAAWGRARRAIGGDCDGEAIVAARRNAGRLPSIARWDATHLPLATASVDVVVTNPPYGRRHAANGGIERLYSRSLREIARVLRPGGRCVVLTGEPDVLRRSLPATLKLRKRHRFLLRGLAVTAFVMDRP